MSEKITVATANTHMGQAVREVGGLGLLGNVDILLLQEVNLPTPQLERRIDKELGLNLAAFSQEFGLAIAVNPDYDISPPWAETLQPRGPIGRKLLEKGGFMPTSQFRTRARGFLSVTVDTVQDNQLNVVTAHPTVPLKYRSRQRQISNMMGYFSGVQGPVLAGADYNYWPKPNRADRQTQSLAHFNAVELDGPTFNMSRTRYAIVGSALGKLGINPNGQLDAMLYRGNIRPTEVKLVDIPSDHKAIVATFVFGAANAA